MADARRDTLGVSCPGSKPLPGHGAADPGVGGIPAIIHQIWKDEDIPPVWRCFAESWKRHHPEWEYRLWTDRSARNYVAENYPEALPAYDAFPYDIQRADFARYLILHGCGGVYADLDMECLRPVSPLLVGRTFVACLEPEKHARAQGVGKMVCNAFMASVPRHPFLTQVIGSLTASPPDVPSHRDRPHRSRILPPVEKKLEAGKRIIGYTVWETDKPPRHWLPILNSLDGLLVPCRWNKEVFEKHGVRVPISVIPHIPDGQSLPRKEVEGTGAAACTFYTINTWTARKALWATLHSYLLAFSRGDAALLLIKTTREDFTRICGQDPGGLVRETIRPRQGRRHHLPAHRRKQAFPVQRVHHVRKKCRVRREVAGKDDRGLRRLLEQPLHTSAASPERKTPRADPYRAAPDILPAHVDAAGDRGALQGVRPDLTGVVSMHLWSHLWWSKRRRFHPPPAGSHRGGPPLQPVSQPFMGAIGNKGMNESRSLARNISRLSGLPRYTG